MKKAICEKCGQDLGGMVPDEATEVTCFRCSRGLSLLTFTCPDCGVTSYNPNDALNSYCGRCHTFHGELTLIVPLEPTERAITEEWVDRFNAALNDPERITRLKEAGIDPRLIQMEENALRSLIADLEAELRHGRKH